MACCRKDVSDESRVCATGSRVAGHCENPNKAPLSMLLISLSSAFRNPAAKYLETEK